MEKEKHTESASRQPDNGAAEKGKKTKTYKHVKLEHKRPQLTKGGEAGDGAQKKRKPTQKKRSSSAGKDPKAKLKIIPLGGLDAIGKNMTVFECGNDMIVDDAGLMFPDDNHPGVDLILPDYTYVLEHADKLRGIVITHGHEDHTGTIPYLLKDLDRPVPIYATKLTLGLIEGKLAEHRIKNAKLVEIKPGQQVKMGCFTTEFFAVNHSIPGAVGVFLQSPAGNVLHTGDFKLDQTPIDGVHFDFGALARYHEIGVDLMMSDSTNATKSTFTPSEAEVGKTLNRIISQAKQRVIIAIALACNPKLLIADEPTTALDVTIQAQIMDLLVELKDKINTAIILITHDLGVVAGIADRVAVMYAGKVVETGTTAQIFYEHKHPYTEALLRSLPSAEAGKREPLMSIPGTPPDLLCPPKGCGFAARCRHCMQICREEQPPEFELGDGHKASCWLLHPDCPCAAERGDDQ